MDNRVTEGNYRQFGVQRAADGMTFTFAGAKEDDCAVILYDEGFRAARRIEAPERFCRGAVRSITVQGLAPERLLYNYEINGKRITDPYAVRIAGREKWNDGRRREQNYFICGGFADADYAWSEANPPEVKKGEMVMYKLHVRGFSMDAGLRGKERGTFAAIEGKIPYLKSLGVTTLELMPVYEFEEIGHGGKEGIPEYLNWESRETDLMKPEVSKGPEKLNYWGYATGFYFAPKASYAKGDNAAAEFKHLVDALHQNGMECVLEMYFEEEENQNLILDALRYWTTEFKVDGFHLIGANVPIVAIAQDLYLKRTKIFYESFPKALWEEKERYPHLFVYNEEYLYAGRKLLNRQGGTLSEFCNQQKKQNGNVGFVNFLTNNNGFTLYDLFSYCEKHNLANGEDNTDGSNYNYSVNCGYEGRTTRKYVCELRRKRVYMAYCMLFFAQGVPLILAGDEFLNSQSGNNNAYCQDNKTGWLNWRNLDRHREFADFVAWLSAFRAAHPVVRQEDPVRFHDYLHTGCPDVSYHSDNAWTAYFPEDRAAFGVMYNGGYAKRADGTDDDFVYVGYNFHTGINELALPRLAKEKKWYLLADTGRTPCVLAGETALENQSKIVVKPQTAVILLGK